MLQAARRLPDLKKEPAAGFRLTGTSSIPDDIDASRPCLCNLLATSAFVLVAVSILVLSAIALSPGVRARSAERCSRSTAEAGSRAPLPESDKNGQSTDDALVNGRPKC